MQTPTSQMTAAQLRELGAEAFDAGLETGADIYDISIRSLLTNDELLEFDAGYFARQREHEGQGIGCLKPV